MCTTYIKLHCTFPEFNDKGRVFINKTGMMVKKLLDSREITVTPVCGSHEPSISQEGLLFTLALRKLQPHFRDSQDFYQTSSDTY